MIEKSGLSGRANAGARASRPKCSTTSSTWKDSCRSERVRAEPKREMSDYVEVSTGSFDTTPTVLQHGLTVKLRCAPPAADVAAT
jgi:hypothetical protein